jgi:hypothetical protein
MWHILAAICFSGFSFNVHHLTIITTAIHKTNAETWFLSHTEGACLRKLHTKGFHDLHSLPNTIRVIKTRRMRWAGHVAYRRKNSYRVLVGKPKKMRLL